ncbi:hypothetical protein AEAC466_03395 [Asticcacaulis sp. AC466]|nr:hypothetical protein AEAC466_03395 [Asticcacaulis sp. AC466]
MAFITRHATCIGMGSSYPEPVLLSLANARKPRSHWTRFATRAFDIFAVALIFSVFG